MKQRPAVKMKVFAKTHFSQTKNPLHWTPRWRGSREIVDLAENFRHADEEDRLKHLATTRNPK